MHETKASLGVNCASTLQNDILKEFHAQNEIVFPPEPSVRLVADVIEFCTAHVPQWNTVSISGYHIREAGSTAVQESPPSRSPTVFTTSIRAWRADLNIDAFAPRAQLFLQRPQ